MKTQAVKKTVLFLAICVLTTLAGSSQTNVYHPFPVSNTIWIGRHLAGTDQQVINDYNLYISGDTTIGSYTYHKFYQNGRITYSPPANQDYYYGKYIGAFRQDIPNKKVYLYKDGVDTLAYNFNLHVGDTIPPNCLTFAYRKIYIKSIDSVIVDNQYRKRFWMQLSSSSQNYELIEGVGSIFGAFDRIEPFFEGGDNLYCVRMNQKTAWTSSSGGPYCNLTASIDNVTMENEVTLSQNPFSTITTVVLNTNLQNSTLAIYDSSGKLVRQLTNIYGNSVMIRRDNLPTGIYFLHLSQGNKILATEKLVISDN